ncbi:MAG: LPS export ABC transporter periplasmic protein LptC [Gallionella sp.]|nr:LPS export ABC transporter periplasmic protein LptC [Gallionella sp.]
MTFASRARHWLPIIPLLGLLGLTYWLNQQVQPLAVQAETGPRHDPDASMENFSAIKFDDQGHPRFLMAAKKMLHYPDDDTATLDMPRITTLSQDHPPIHTAARSGTVNNRSDEIFLTGDVEVVREASAGRSELTLQTEHLHLLPNKDWAETADPVVIFDAQMTTHAIGLEMDNKARTLKLLAQVRSIHAPNPQ